MNTDRSFLLMKFDDPLLCILRMSQKANERILLIADLKIQTFDLAALLQSKDISGIEFILFHSVNHNCIM